MTPGRFYIGRPSPDQSFVIHWQETKCESEVSAMQKADYEIPDERVPAYVGQAIDCSSINQLRCRVRGYWGKVYIAAHESNPVVVKG
jgi:hypothetical protein